MDVHYLKFESKTQYEEAINGEEWSVETSIIYPLVTEETGEILKDEDGNEYAEVKPKDGFFINCLGDYPDVLASYEVTVDSPQYKWA